MWTTVLLVIHLMIAAALVAVVLLQRSEGGALGMGGGGGGGFLTGRGTANLLTRTTAILAACFFITSIGLTLMANQGARQGSVFDRATTAPAGKAGETAPKADAKTGEPAAGETKAPAAPAGRGGVLDKLQGGAPSGPVVPQSK